MTILNFTSAYADDSGDKVSGTIFDKSFYESIQTAINNLIHSANNTGVTPADIIDEVVAARGNAVDLDTRISGVIDDDGNFTAGLSQPNLESQVLAEDLIWNGDMDRWDPGSSAGGGASGTVPNGYSGSGTSATFAQAGNGKADATVLGVGDFCTKITRSGTDCYLSWKLIDAVTGAFVPDLTRLRGQKVAFIALVKASTASQARLKIEDDGGTSTSSYHPGDNTIRLLPVVHTITSSAAANGITAKVEVNNSDGDVYTSGWKSVISDTAPSDWSPNSLTSGAFPFIASDEAPGLVDCPIIPGSQQVLGRGKKRFTRVPRFYLGTVDDGVGDDAYAVGFVGTDNTDVASVTGGDTDVHSRTLNADSFSGDGEVLEVEFFMIHANNSNTKKFSFDFAGNTVTIINNAFQQVWSSVHIKVVATGATTADVFLWGLTQAGTVIVKKTALTNLDWTVNQTYKGILPASTANDDTTVEMSTVRAYSN